MAVEDGPEAMSIGQLGHHIGLHVSVNLVGKTVGEQLFGSDHWVQGVVVGLSGTGDYVTIRLDEPIGGEAGHGLLHRSSKGQDMVMFDDPTKVRAMSLDETQPGGVPDEIVELVRAGKRNKAILRYRELNGATLDEALAAIAKLS